MKIICTAVMVFLSLHVIAQSADSKAAPAAKTWTTYTSTIGDFKVQFPGKPKTSIQNNNETPSYSASLELDDTAYVASYAAFKNVVPLDKADTVLEGAQNGMRDNASARAKIVTQEKLTFQGLPARRIRYFFTSDGQELAGESLLVFVGDSLYQFMVLHAPPGPDQDDAAKFFASVSLQGAKYRGPDHSAADTKPAK